MVLEVVGSQMVILLFFKKKKASHYLSTLQFLSALLSLLC